MEIPRDREQLVEFLCNDEWPFHEHYHLTPDDVLAMDFSSADVATFWVVETGEKVGLIRLLDLGDIGRGAPLFDLRVLSRRRGRGFGTLATRWIVDHLFTSHPELHRIEANTREDNTAMQRVLTGAGFTNEGRLRRAWRSEEGRWFDTMVYGMLRTDWTSSDNGDAQR